MNIVIRGGLSARIVVGDSNVTLAAVERVKQQPKKVKNVGSSVFKAVSLDLESKKNSQRQKKANIKNNIGSYEKQSQVVEKKLNNLSQMEKSYLAGVEKLQKIRKECEASGDKEQLDKITQLEQELKDLHNDVVGGYGQCMPSVSDWEKDSEQDVCETPDILGELNNSSVGFNSNKNQ